MHDPTSREAVLRLAHYFPVVPACRPRPDGSCSAPWHTHEPRDSGKVPLVAGYTGFVEHPPGPEGCLAFFERNSMEVNVGIVIPASMVVVDTDSPEAAAEFSGLLPPDFITPVRTARSGRGPCWLMRTPPGVTLKTAPHKGLSGAIDILAPGHFFVVPRSLHLSGHVHQWAPGMAPWEMPIAMVPESALNAIMAWAEKTEKGLTASRPSTAPFVSVLPKAGAADINHGRRLVRARSRLSAAFNGKKASGDTSASGLDFSFAVAALNGGIRPEVVAGLLGERPGLHRATDEYVERTVVAAMKALGLRP